MEALAVTKLLEKYKTSLNAACMLKCLTASGVLRDVNYESTSGSGEIKTFKEISPDHIKYGANIPTMHELKTEPRFYSERFVELLEIAVCQLKSEIEDIKKHA